MTFTLWRGDHLLGELRKPAHDPYDQDSDEEVPTSLFAFLVPASGASLNGVWQVRMPFPEFSSVFQFPMEPDIVAERFRGDAESASFSLQALEPMSAEAAKGVPREAQLTVHDSTGRVYLPRRVMLQEVRYELEHYEAVLREVPAGALVDGSAWSVHVSLAPHRDAPDI